MLREVEAAISLPTYNLKQDHAKTENIRFYGKYSLHCILRSHVSAVLAKHFEAFFLDELADFQKKNYI